MRVILDKFCCNIVKPWNLLLRMRQRCIGWSVVWYIFNMYLYIIYYHTKNFMAFFYGWCSTASRLEPLRGDSLFLPLGSQKFLLLILSTSEYVQEIKLVSHGTWNQYPWIYVLILVKLSLQARHINNIAQLMFTQDVTSKNTKLCLNVGNWAGLSPT